MTGPGSGAAGAPEIAVRPVAAGDREAWGAIYRGYRDFYNKPHDPAVYDVVWEWLFDDAHESRCLIATLDGVPVGLGHFRSFARPIDGVRGIYLDDLFTSPAARGTGAATAIIERLGEIARDENAALVRWITADSNETARRIYDRVAAQTPWVTYDMAPAAG